MRFPRLPARSWLFVFGVCATALYAALALTAGICGSLSVHALSQCATGSGVGWSLGNLGDQGSFLSGVFTPLALIWFVVGVWLQQQELGLVRREYHQMTRANEEQVNAMVLSGRTAGREMVLNLIERADEDTKESLDSVMPVFEELKHLAKMYPGDDDTETVLHLVPSKILQFVLMIPIFYANDSWISHARSTYSERADEWERFTVCVRSLAFFITLVAERYERIRELALESDFVDVFDTRFAASEERLLYECCKRWAPQARHTVEELGGGVPRRTKRKRPKGRTA